MIYIKQSSGKGRGVYTDRVLLPGDVIESAPVIVIPENERKLIGTTVLDSFVFEWGSEGEKIAIVLGFGSLYNHSSSPNAHYDKDFDNSTVNFVCVSKINENEEIFINYNGNECESIPIVFEGDTWKSGVE